MREGLPSEYGFYVCVRARAFLGAAVFREAVCGMSVSLCAASEKKSAEITILYTPFRQHALLCECSHALPRG